MGPMPRRKIKTAKPIGDVRVIFFDTPEDKKLWTYIKTVADVNTRTHIQQAKHMLKEAREIETSGEE